MSKLTMFASVIIPTYNRDHLLIDTIQYVLRNNYKAFEVVVVDQTRGHPERIMNHLQRLRCDSRFKYIKISLANASLARNVGLRYAKGDVIIYIDDDVELAEDFIAAHVRRYEDPQVGAVAGRVVELGTPLVHEPDERLRDRPRPGRLRPDGTGETHFNQVGYRGEVEWGQGCNMSFRRAALEQIGGFDERYAVIREDVDVFYRIRKKGWKAVFEPDAKVTHLKESKGGWRSEEFDKILDQYTSRSLFAIKNQGWKGWLHYFSYQPRAMYSLIRMHNLSYAKLLKMIKSQFKGIYYNYFVDPYRFSKKVYIEYKLNL
ncbi:glycosyltransferase family 2 protein [Rhodothermus marinus]|uniref:glycosyltransferase family 2 protein n=1 Tax=Rhodothermus marinus TaxID=29549 RepID=UPI0012BA37BE|nr:glycosyltransferase [Rhodothermus marinus]BBM69333.1 hypothetical protein RmaAA213_11790 [Rhodothermus marinus]